MRAISLDTPHNMEEENELNDLKTRLEFTNNLVINLGKQIDQLKSTVSSLRAQFYQLKHFSAIFVCFKINKKKSLFSGNSFGFTPIVESQPE